MIPPSSEWPRWRQRPYKLHGVWDGAFEPCAAETPCGRGGRPWGHCGVRTPPSRSPPLGFVCLSAFEAPATPGRKTCSQSPSTDLGSTHLLCGSHPAGGRHAHAYPPPPPDGINTWSRSPRRAALHTSGSWAVSAVGFVQCECPLSTQESMVTFKFRSGSLGKDSPPWNRSPWFPWRRRGSQDTVTSTQVIPSLIYSLLPSPRLLNGWVTQRASRTFSAAPARCSTSLCSVNADGGHCVARKLHGEATNVKILLSYCCGLIAELCLTLCESVDYSPPGSSVHGILQARILEWISNSFSKGPFRPRHWTLISYNDRWVLYHWAPREAPNPTISVI